MKRELPLFLTAVIAFFMILSFFVPHQFVSVPADFLLRRATECGDSWKGFGGQDGGRAPVTMWRVPFAA